MINVTVNGKDHEFSSTTPLTEYLDTLNVNSRMIAVAYNGEVLRREEWESITLFDGDEVEVVQAVGGG